MRVSITEKDFEALVNGKVITKTIGKKKFNVEIALQDIGYVKMQILIELALHKKDRERAAK